MRVTAITHRKQPIVPSYISQVAPSESSVIKRVAYEPLFLAHLRDTLGIRGVKRVSLHEPLTGLLRLTVDRASRRACRAPRSGARSTARRSSRAIAARSASRSTTTSIRTTADALFWAIAYRSNPVEDVQLVPHRGQGHGPKREHGGERGLDAC